MAMDRKTAIAVLTGMRNSRSIYSLDDEDRNALALAIDVLGLPPSPPQPASFPPPPTSFDDLTRIKVLVICRDQFLSYEKSHRAKKTIDGDIKADINLVYANMITRVLNVTRHE
jgi:hypothetical protein